MFLKEIETRPVTGMMQVAFRKLEEGGHTVPEIMHLFRFKRDSTRHLVRFTQEVMRGPSPLSQGMRELIGALVSRRNQCAFCSCAHAPVAAELLGQEVVDEVMEDLEGSTLDLAQKELLRYVVKLTENPALTNASDIDRLKELGWSEEAIYDGLTVASLFKFYNTWNNGSGVRTMAAADYRASSQRLLTMGYCMDFGLKSLLKVLWRGRHEARFSDWKAVLLMPLDCLRAAFGSLFSRWRSASPRRVKEVQSVRTVATSDLPTRLLPEVE